MGALGSASPAGVWMTQESRREVASGVPQSVTLEEGRLGNRGAT
jgi:hypothetical protein